MNHDWIPVQEQQKHEDDNKTTEDKPRVKQGVHQPPSDKHFKRRGLEKKG